jgi:hypothetical protein
VRREVTARLLSVRKLALARVGRDVQYSHHDEQELIGRLTADLPAEQRLCVDIGASDGVEGSNSLPLYRDGWGGLAVELDRSRFAMLSLVLRSVSGVGLARVGVTPPTVCDLLRAYGIPREFGLVDLDIDGYDHFVLDALLGEFRPRVIVAEINEKIPPSLRFTVKWSPGYEYRDDNFFGQSLAALVQLAERHGYALVQLHYNNAFLVAAEHHTGARLSVEEAYTRGYAERSDRLERFPWNAEFEPLRTMAPEAAEAWLDRYFADRRGEYELEIVS